MSIGLRFVTTMFKASWGNMKIYNNLHATVPQNSFHAEFAQTAIQH